MGSTLRVGDYHGLVRLLDSGALPVAEVELRVVNGKGKGPSKEQPVMSTFVLLHEIVYAWRGGRHGSYGARMWCRWLESGRSDPPRIQKRATGYEYKDMSDGGMEEDASR